MLLPKKTLIEKAIANGTMERLNVLLSAAHLLNSEANNILSECEDLMRENGLLLGEIKRENQRFLKAADALFKDYAMMIPKDMTMGYFEDLEAFDRAFRKWAKISNNIKQDEHESE